MNKADVIKIQKAVVVAAFSHGSQVDKQGQPYIFHPIRVASKFREPIEQIVAILHDVLEDTGTMSHEIEDVFGATVAHFVNRLTKPDDMPYNEYIKSLSDAPFLLRIKLADMDDNLDRLYALPEKEQYRLIEKYQWARQYIVQKLRHARVDLPHGSPLVRALVFNENTNSD